MWMASKRVSTRQEAEEARATGEAWVRLKMNPDFQSTFGTLVAELMNEPNTIDLDAIPFDKLEEAAWQLQGSKLLLNRIMSIMKQWDGLAQLDTSQFAE